MASTGNITGNGTTDTFFVSGQTLFSISGTWDSGSVAIQYLNGAGNYVTVNGTDDTALAITADFNKLITFPYNTRAKLVTTSVASAADLDWAADPLS